MMSIKWPECHMTILCSVLSLDDVVLTVIGSKAFSTHPIQLKAVPHMIASGGHMRCRDKLAPPSLAQNYDCSRWHA